MCGNVVREVFREAGCGWNAAPRRGAVKRQSPNCRCSMVRAMPRRARRARSADALMRRRITACGVPRASDMAIPAAPETEHPWRSVP